MSRTEKAEFKTDSETLSGLKYLTDEKEKPKVLFLHGAGKANKDRAKPLAEELLKSGASSFAFDFSGHGESTGRLQESSLQKRTSEAKEALKFLDTTKPISIIAFSMGGHIALELLNEIKVKSLILFYPAIYSKKSFTLLFNESFTKAIRKKNSWKDTSILPNLKTFSGKLLLVVGEKDEVIPSEVPEFILNNATNVTEKEQLIIPNAPHLFLPLVFNNTTLRSLVLEKLKEYIF